MQQENVVQQLDRMLIAAPAITQPIALSNSLFTALSKIYQLSVYQIQQLSSGMYGKTEVFRLLSDYSDVEAYQVVCLRLLYFILYTSVTCSDFVLSNVIFVEKLIDYIAIEDVKCVNSAKADSPVFGSFFNADEPLPFDYFVGCTQLIDAKIAVLEVISRCSAQGRLLIYKHEATFLAILHGFSVLEIFAPMRICGVLQVLLHLVIFEGCKKCDKYIAAVKAAATKLFSGNTTSLERLADMLYGQAPDRSQCMVYNPDGRVLFTSEELYYSKCVLLSLFCRLRSIATTSE